MAKLHPLNSPLSKPAIQHDLFAELYPERLTEEETLECQRNFLGFVELLVQINREQGENRS